MKITEALEKISNTKNRLYRDNWPYTLYFNYCGFLVIDDGKMDLTPYTLSDYDFNYEWKIKK